MEKFTKLGLSKGLVETLRGFGFKEPSEIQEKTIPLALKGRDIIGGSATGSGKTLAFASAIIENLKPNGNIQALVLTPTRELAEQVAKSIRDFGKGKNLKVLAVYGGVSIEQQIRKLSTTDVLVGTPGRILDHLNRRTLSLRNVRFLVLDEVDRMFDMGFRNDVEKIINECPKERQTMLFSATISGGIDYLAKKYTKNPVEVSLESHVDPSKLTQVYYDVPDGKKFSLLVTLLKNENADLVMVFCSTRRNVDFVADNLIRSGINAKAIHGKIEQKKRIRVLDEFHKKGLGVLVCTDVAGRGLDIKGVSHVYNYDVPADSKDYIHRIGRTARAGKEGKAITILASRDYEKFSDLTRMEDLKITPMKLPELQFVRIKMPESTRGRGSRFGGRERRETGRGRTGDRRHNDNRRGQTRGRSFSRGPSKSRNNSNRREEPRTRYSGNNSNRNSYSRGRSNDRGRSSSRAPVVRMR